MFDRMGRQFDQQPLSSYAGNNALAGLAANFGQGGFDKQRLGGMRGGMGLQPPVMPPAPMPMQQPQVMPGQVPMDAQSALAGFGQAAPSTIAPGGLPQQFQDWRQQMQDWRGLRPDRQEFMAGMAPGMDRRDMRADWRGQMQDWRGQRPQFANWR